MPPSGSPRMGRVRTAVVVLALATCAAWITPPAHAGEAENAASEGHKQYKQKKYREAASFFELAISLGGNKADNYYWASMGHSQAMEDQDAYEWILGALSLDDSDPRYHAQHGRVCMYLGTPGEAAMAFEKALAAVPADAELWAQYGRVLKQSGHPYQSIEALQKALELDPSKQDVAFELGLAMVELKDPQQAIGAFRKAVAADPKCLDCHISLGDALLASRQFDGALAAYADALRQDADDYRARERSVQACYGSGDYAAADPHKRALEKLYARGKVYGLSAREGYVVDEFSVGDLTVQTWEYFEGQGPEGVAWSFDAIDPTGWKEAEFAARSATIKKGGKARGVRGLELVPVTDGISGEMIVAWPSSPSYPTVKTAVQDQLKNR
jgi:tetratricopeptide (TPR) repeat protein